MCATHSILDLVAARPSWTAGTCSYRRVPSESTKHTSGPEGALLRLPARAPKNSVRTHQDCSNLARAPNNIYKCVCVCVCVCEHIRTGGALLQQSGPCAKVNSSKNTSGPEGHSCSKANVNASTTQMCLRPTQIGFCLLLHYRLRCWVFWCLGSVINYTGVDPKH